MKQKNIIKQNNYFFNRISTDSHFHQSYKWYSSQLFIFRSDKDVLCMASTKRLAN